MSRDVLSAAAENLAEITAVVQRTDPDGLAELVHAIDSSPRVYFQGSGRTLLMIKAVAMRLMHMGVPVHIVGDVLTPAISSGDLLIAVSARGGAGTRAAIQKATAAGARVAAITTRRENLDGAADLVVAVPARVDVNSVQHAGSLFEQSVLVLGDAMCRIIQGRRGVPTEVLTARHANL